MFKKGPPRTNCQEVILNPCNSHVLRWDNIVIGDLHLLKSPESNNTEYESVTHAHIGYKWSESHHCCRTAFNKDIPFLTQEVIYLLSWTPKSVYCIILYSHSHWAFVLRDIILGENISLMDIENRNHMAIVKLHSLRALHISTKGQHSSWHV